MNRTKVTEVLLIFLVVFFLLVQAEPMSMTMKRIQRSRRQTEAPDLNGVASSLPKCEDIVKSIPLLGQILKFLCPLVDKLVEQVNSVKVL
jgi:hypothetical protein